MDLAQWQVTLTLGGLLAAALVGGFLAGFLRLPKVTAYLLVGMLLGPSVLKQVPPEHAHLLQPLTKMAIALVLFNLGCRFPMPRVRRILPRVLRVSAWELSATFLFVAVGLALLGTSPAVALLLGALALATAPATTILVLKEVESEGPVTEYAGALVAVNNVVAIVAFEALFVGIHFAQGKLDVPALVQLRLLLQDLAGSTALGVAAGLIVSFSYALVEENCRLALLVAVVTVLLGVCQWLGVPYLIAFLVMGVTLANASSHERQVTAELDRLTGLLCVVFFVTHGVEMDLGALAQAGMIGGGYIVFRLAGKYFGARIGLRRDRQDPSICRWLGLTLMSQAGAAIALSQIALQRDPDLGRPLMTVILGTVVFFEIVGPILIRRAVFRAGEVPLAHAIHHTETGAADEWRALWNRVLEALGRDPWRRKSTAEVSVREIMRSNIKGVPLSATFVEVVNQLEHTHDNTLPVVDESGEVAGVIRYRDLSSVLFDSRFAPLVRAADLAVPTRRVLHPDEAIARACRLFSASKDDTIPVVAREEPQCLVGVVRRRDVLRMMVRGQAGDAAEPSA